MPPEFALASMAAAFHRHHRGGELDYVMRDDALMMQTTARFMQTGFINTILDLFVSTHCAMAENISI